MGDFFTILDPFFFRCLFSSIIQVIGRSINSYNNYEKGEVPSQANANLISMAKKPEAILGLLVKVKDNFTLNAYDKLSSRINIAIAEDSKFDPFICAINHLNNPSRFTGYKTPDLEKIACPEAAAFATALRDVFERLHLDDHNRALRHPSLGGGLPPALR